MDTKGLLADDNNVTLLRLLEKCPSAPISQLARSDRHAIFRSEGAISSLGRIRNPGWLSPLHNELKI